MGSRRVNDRKTRYATVSAIPLLWGAWDLWTGAWHPNPHITMSVDDQHKVNLANGYSCEHRCLPTLCPVCRAQRRSGESS